MTRGSRTRWCDAWTDKPEEGGSEVSGDSWASLCCPCLIRAPGIGWQREAHRSQRRSPSTCPTKLWLTHSHTPWRMQYALYCLQKTLRLTRVDLLQGDVLLQLPTEFDLRAILPAGAIVSQDEVWVAVVEHSQLAQWVRHRLIRSVYLEREEEISFKNVSKRECFFQETKCSCKCPHIFSNEVLFVFQDPPWSDPYCAHLPPWLGGMVL